MAKSELGEYSLRRAIPADWAPLHQLLVRSWLTSWAPHLPEDAVRRFQETDPTSVWLNAELRQIVVAVLDGKIVDAMQVDGCTLEDIHVEPDLKGQGIGSVLLQKAEDMGARRLVVRAFNEPAMAFYEARGWVRIRSFDATEMGVPMETVEYMKS